MDDATAHKVRDLKLKILHVEKELAASLHNANLGAWLKAGHAAQMARANERERKRLEEKLDGLKAQLAELSPESVAPALAPIAAEKPAEKKAPAPKKTPAPKKAAEPKKTVAKKTAEPKKAAAKKTAATKAAAAKTPAKKTAKKK